MGEVDGKVVFFLLDLDDPGQVGELVVVSGKDLDLEELLDKVT